MEYKPGANSLLKLITVFIPVEIQSKTPSTDMIKKFLQVLELLQMLFTLLII
jgi:hypothetical protein